MRAWAILLGGLTIWAAHFFALYGIASALPGRPEARWLVVAATVAAVAGNALILWQAFGRASRSDELERWLVHLGGLGAAISMLAVLWQVVPVLIV